MAERQPHTTEWRLFGLPATQVQERLADLSADEPAALVQPLEDGVVAVRLPETAAPEAAGPVGAYVYTRQGQTLPQRVVELLTHHGKTVATAESCTGGLVAAGLTAVPGSSRVFGTGVVSYSWDCKQALLDVDKDTLACYGAVSAPVAQQMARGVRRRAGADLGVAVTGEAGPTAGEDKPVGTVFVALADARRTWVRELHLEKEADGRQAIRRLAAAHVLDLLRRYLEACPAVMAGGVLHRALDKQRIIPKAGSTGDRRWWLTLIPHRGDSLRRLVFKIGAWALALAVLVCATAVGLTYLKGPDDNRLLQDSLGDLYWGGTADLTVDEEDTADRDVNSYPAGMFSTFRSLYDRNPDVAGWLHIPDTAIDYPVMNYADGYYKNHSFDGQYSLYGQPYFHEGGHLFAEGLPRTMTIHGKNTRDGQMFSSLLSYRRIAYLRENPVIELNTLYTAARFEVFAVLLVNTRSADAPDYAKTKFADEGAFESHLRDLQSRALFRSQRAVTASDRVLFLSTEAEAEYGYTGARFVVAARLLSEEESTATYYANRSTVTRTTTTTTRRLSTTTAVKTTTTTTATAPTEDSKATTSVTVAESTTSTTLSTEETTSTTEKNTQQTENQENADIGN